MTAKEIRRGYNPKDRVEFSGVWLDRLQKAAQELKFLLERGYDIKGAATFIGNHYMLSERQRLALKRVVSSKVEMDLRASKQLNMEEVKEAVVHIDAFNTIITLEVALSESLILQSMDSTVRDLAGLRGTYRIIDKTYLAVELLFKHLTRLGVKKAIFYLDAPVSNSGRLKSLLQDEGMKCQMLTEAFVINDVDRTLEKLSHVITSDTIILNKCISWINLNEKIIREDIPFAWYVTLY